MINKIIFNFRPKVNSKIIENSVDGILANRKERFNHLSKIELENFNKVQKNVDAYTNEIISFELFMDHTCQKSQKADAILNYYQVSFKRNQNILHLRDFLWEFKQAELPSLRVFESFEKAKVISGQQNIENFLIINDFIYKTHEKTAWSLQGIEFAKSVLEDLDRLFYSPALTFQNIFKSVPETYRSNQRSAIVLRVLRLTFQKIIYNIFLNLMKINKEKQQEAKANFVKKMKEWDDRLQGKNFHGGEIPDEADFELYAALKSKFNSTSFQRFLEKNLSMKSNGWFLRMRMKCKYEEYREYIQ